MQMKDLTKRTQHESTIEHISPGFGKHFQELLNHCLKANGHNAVNNAIWYGVTASLVNITPELHENGLLSPYEAKDKLLAL